MTRKAKIRQIMRELKPLGLTLPERAKLARLCQKGSPIGEGGIGSLTCWGNENKIPEKLREKLVLRAQVFSLTREHDPEARLISIEGPKGAVLVAEPIGDVEITVLGGMQ